jgi:D-alanyl-D-alanine-carboxypeptidase/D-alanyl-D-alanine-endopeptidase
VLARILELASGKDYGTLLREELLAPLGMTHTLHADAISLVPGRAQDYVPGAHGIENAPMQDFSGLVGAGSVWSTAEDLHRLVQAVVTGRLGEVPRQSFVRGGRLSFDGRTAGFKAYATFDSTSGLEVIWVGNLVTGASDLLRAALPRLAAGEAVPPPSLPTPLATAPAADRLGRYVGSFRLENGVTLVMRVRDGVLWANDWVLLPVGEDTFFSPRDYGSVRGRAGPEGRIETLEWTQNGQVYPAPRIGN